MANVYTCIHFNRHKLETENLVQVNTITNQLDPVVLQVNIDTCNSLTTYHI